MKNAFTSTLLLTIVGFVVLVAGALYFGAPLFGWVILLAIFAVFLVEQAVALKKLKQISEETAILESCEKNGNLNVEGDGVVAKRIRLARELTSKKIRLDSPMAYDVLNSNVGIPVPRSAGSTVILLGLMGTFFGLMYSVATAGGAIDNSTTQGTLDTIQLLFQGMKGIFGTSLCGLFAALVLNGSRSMLNACRDSFMARLDALTLNVQGYESNEVEQSKNELERLFDAVEVNLKEITSAVQEGLSGIVTQVGEDMAASVKSMNESFSAAMNGMTAPMENSMKSLSASVENIPSMLDEKLKGLSSSLDAGLGNIAGSVKNSLEGVSQSVETALGKVSTDVKSSLDGVAGSVGDGLAESSKSIAVSVADQVKQSNVQWNEFMQRLEERTNNNVDAEREGLETLKNVALQVAEKAQAGSAELSASVSEKLSTLSNDILSAFQKLSETSSVLLEAQKALTESIDNRVVKEKEATDALGGNIVETAELMRVNQSELSANLEMLRAGLETILEKLSGDTAEHEEEESFVEHLNQSLEAFHERASEVLMENAVKTQEILLEVLEQTQRAGASAPASQPKVEG